MAITFTGAVSLDWNDPSNWDTYNIPTTGDDVIISGGFSVTGTTPAELFMSVTVNDTCSLALSLSAYDFYFNDYSANSASQNGRCTFYGSSINNSSIVGDTVFADTSYNIGVIIGLVAFNGDSYNYGTFGGAIIGDAIFNDSSYNLSGNISGNANFNTTYYHASVPSSGIFRFSANDWSGSVAGVVIGSDYTIITSFRFTGTTKNSGTITSDCIFSDSSFNENLIYGNCTFNDTSYNNSLIFGNCIFNSSSYNNNSIIGTCILNDSSYSYIGASVSSHLTINTDFYGTVPTTDIFDITVMDIVMYGHVGGLLKNSLGATINTINFYNNTANGSIADCNYNFFDTSYNQAPLPSLNIIFNDNSLNVTTITSTIDVIFNDTSRNAGNIINDAVFNDGSYNDEGGSIGGGIFRNDSYNIAYIYNYAYFYDNSSNAYIIAGDAYVRQHADVFISWRDYATVYYVGTIHLQFPEMDVLGAGLI